MMLTNLCHLRVHLVGVPEFSITSHELHCVMSGEDMMKMKMKCLMA